MAIAVLAIVIGAIVAIIVYLKQRSRKSLSYKVLTVTQLLSIKSELKGKLKISYDTKEVEDVSLVLVEIFNSGNTPIIEDDYKNPVTLDFGEKAQILAAEVTKVEPSNLQISASAVGNRITISPTLINAGDSMTIKSLVTKLSAVNVTGRIVGVKEIEESIPKLSSTRVQLLLLIGMQIIGLTSFYVFGFVFNQIAIAGMFFISLFLIPNLMILIYYIIELLLTVYLKLRHK